MQLIPVDTEEVEERDGSRLRTHALTVVASLVLALSGGQLLAGALTAGVAVDELAHVDRAQSWLDTGWYVPGKVMTNGRPDPSKLGSSPYVYGPAFTVLAHAANVIVGNEAANEISESAAAYKVRHMAVAVLGFLTAAAVGLIVFALTRSTTFGLWASAALLAIPAWTGHSFFNPKDVPAAAGYTLLTAGLVLGLRSNEHDPASEGRQVLIVGLLIAGIYFSVGTRPALAVAMAASLLTFLVLAIARKRMTGSGPDKGTIAIVVLGICIGFAVATALFTSVGWAPWLHVERLFGDAVNYPWEGFNLTAGHLLPERPPWWNLPAWAFASVPVGIFLLSVLGVVSARSLLNRKLSSFLQEGRVELVLVVLQAALLPVGTLVMGAVMYGGIRQHLYMIPAIAALAGVGAFSFWGWASRRGSRLWTGGATVFLALALAVPLVEQVQLFPYNYTYVNPVAGIGGVNDRWETDGYWVSAPEALSRVPKAVELRCSGWLVRPWEPTKPLKYTRCEDDRIFQPMLHLRGTDAKPYFVSAREEIWVVGRKRGGNDAPDYCTHAGDVTRRIRNERVVMAHVLRCDAASVRAAEAAEDK